MSRARVVALAASAGDNGGCRDGRTAAAPLAETAETARPDEAGGEEMAMETVEAGSGAPADAGDASRTRPCGSERVRYAGIHATPTVIHA